MVGGALVVLLLATPACTDDDPGTCAALQDLSEAMGDIPSGTLLGEGTEALRAQVADIQDAWRDVEEAAASQFGAELNAMRLALADIETTLSRLGRGEVDGAQVVSDLLGDLALLAGAWEDLVRAADDELRSCDL